jgi:hypothetical protein
VSEELPAAPRKLKRLRVDLVGATPAQIAEQLIRVSPMKAAHTALLITASVGPEILAAAKQRLGRAVQRAEAHPADTASRLISALLEEP